MSDPDQLHGVPIAVLLEHRAWVHALASTLCHDRNDADDLEQELWRVTLERPPGHAGGLRAWFARATKNAAISIARRQEVRSRREAEAIPRRAGPTPEQAVAEAELLARVANAVIALDEPYRTTIVLRYWRDLKPAEIATQLAVPVETVRTRIRRAVQLLRTRIGVDDETSRRAVATLLVHGTQKHSRPATPGVTAVRHWWRAIAWGTSMALGKKLGVAAVVIIAAMALWSWSTSTPDAEGDVGIATGANDGERGAPPNERAETADAHTRRRVESQPGQRAAPPVPEDVPASGSSTRLVIVDVTTGKQVPDAAVLASDQPLPPDADGRRVLVFTAQEPVPVRVSSGGYRDARAAISPGQAVSIVPLIPEPVLQVTTVGPDGEPVGHCAVSVRHVELSGMSADDAEGAVWAGTSDGAGMAEVRGLPLGTFAVIAVPPVSSGEVAPGTASASIEDGRTTACTVRCTTSCEVRGVVVSAADGRPVSGASVSTTAGICLDGSVSTGGNGEFRFERVGNVPRFVRAVHDDFAPTSAQVLPGGETQVRVVLRPLTTRAVHVRRADGSPARGASVWLLDPRWSSRSAIASATTDDSGDCWLSRVPRDDAASFLLCGVSSSGTDRAARLFLLREANDDSRSVLQLRGATPRATLRVLSNGVPVVGVRVRAASLYAGYGIPKSLGPNGVLRRRTPLTSFPPEFVIDGVTNTSGEAELGASVIGRHLVEVMGDTDSQWIVALPPDGGTHEIDVGGYFPSVELRVRVRHDGRPVSACRVEARRGVVIVAEGDTDSHGSATLQLVVLRASQPTRLFTTTSTGGFGTAVYDGSGESVTIDVDR